MSFLHFMFHYLTNFVINHIFLIFLGFQIQLILAMGKLLLWYIWYLYRFALVLFDIQGSLRLIQFQMKFIFL
jgi:hypothetical protein